MMNRTKVLWGVVLTISSLLIVVLALLFVFLLPPDDEVQFFRERRQTLKNHRIEFIKRDADAIRYSVELHSDSGLSVTGFLRLPVSRRTRFPAVLLLGGLRTGKDAMWLLDDLPESNDYVFLTLDYPWDGPPKMSAFEFLWHLKDIRESVWNGVPAMLLAYDFLWNYSAADTQQIIFVGVSLGSFFALPAACIASPSAPVALHFTGADIRRLLKSDLQVQDCPGWLASIVAYPVASVLKPVEPARWAPRGGNRPVLLVNGRNDRRIPTECADQLAEAFPRQPARVWLEGDHISTSNDDLIKELVVITGEWAQATLDSLQALSCEDSVP
jgi:pimeloyl-ACP methyl ester carboxylesterase